MSAFDRLDLTCLLDAVSHADVSDAGMHHLIWSGPVRSGSDVIVMGLANKLTQSSRALCSGRKWQEEGKAIKRRTRAVFYNVCF